MKAKLTALIETGNYSEFDKLFPYFKSKRKQEKYILNFLKELYVKNKNSSDTNLINDKENSKIKKFRKFIENKKIVIVGPAPVEQKDGNQIDKADIVLRTNYKMGDPIIKGSKKCDINYFNLETAYHIHQNGCFEWPIKNLMDSR